MEWVNSIRGPNLTIFFQYITWLGYKDFLFLFVPFCYWFFDRKIFSTFTLFVFISALINAFLKDLFQASMMVETDYLVLAVRELYNNRNDYEVVSKFLDAIYLTKKVKLDLKGVLLVGY